MFHSAVCESGYQYDFTTEVGNCTECPIGYWKDNRIVGSTSLCQRCNGYLVTSSRGATSEDYCIVCKYLLKSDVK